MKRNITKTQTLLSTAVALTLLSACNKTDFSEMASAAPLKYEVPTPVPSPEGPVYGSKLTSGQCNTDSSTQILSCLKCDVPQVTQEPQLSAKAQALLDIMVLACNVSNKSDLNNNRPTRAMILNKLNRASELNYPETKRTAGMTMVIQGLTNPTDGSLRQKMFGGLWYQPPYSDSFETYFGIAVQEAKSTFCWNGDKMDGAVTNKVSYASIEMQHCQNESSTWWNCKERPEYIVGATYRTQLEKSLNLGVTNPYSAPTPDVQKKCFWEKFEGDDLVEAKKLLKKWKSEGRKVSMSVKKNGIGLCGAATDGEISAGSAVEIATYKCQ